MKHWSLKSRILFLAMFPVVSIAVLLTVLVMIGGTSEMDGALKARGMLITRQLAAAGEYGVFSGNREILQGLAQGMMKEKDMVSVLITDNRNKVLAVHGRPSRFDDKAAATVLSGAQQLDSTDLDSLVFVAPITQNSSAVDEFGWYDRNTSAKDVRTKEIGRVYVEMSTVATQHSKNRFVMISLAISLLVLFMALLLALRMSRDVTRPLMRLFKAVQRMTHGHLDTRVAEDSGGELAELEKGFNTMAGELQSAHANMQERIDERTRDLERLKEEALLAKANAELANQAKSQFLAHVSHEIRTPLNGLIGFLGLMGKTAMDDTQQGYLQTCEVSAQSLLEIISDILDLSKIEAGKLSIERLPYDLRNLVEQCIQLYTPVAQNKELFLFLEIDPKMPVHLIGDQVRVRQVVSNLLSNAVKFTHAGAITVTVRQAGPRVEIVVADSGIGMTAEQMDNLFQPFSQGDTSITRRYGGTGLGLAISRRLVELMHGTIEVDSKEGTGSRFTVTLPLIEAHDNAAAGTSSLQSLTDPASFPLETAPGKPAAKAGLRVLVVDDNDINRKLGAILLQQWGVTVDEAANGVSAVGACAKQDYDLILMDIHMPSMDGLEAARRIRAMQRNGKKTPIYALTADVLRGDRSLYLDAGMDGYLEKPLTEAALREVIGKWHPIEEGMLSAVPAKPEAVASGEPPVSPHCGLPVLDSRRGIERAGGHRQDWLTLLKMQLDDLPRAMAAIAEAHTAGDSETLGELAHRLRSGALYCGISALEAAAMELEKACVEEAHDIAERYRVLHQEAESVMALAAGGSIEGL